MAANVARAAPADQGWSGRRRGRGAGRVRRGRNRGPRPAEL